MLDIAVPLTSTRCLPRTASLLLAPARGCRHRRRSRGTTAQKLLSNGNCRRHQYISSSPFHEKWMPLPSHTNTHTQTRTQTSTYTHIYAFVCSTAVTLAFGTRAKEPSQAAFVFHQVPPRANFHWAHVRRNTTQSYCQMGIVIVLSLYLHHLLVPCNKQNKFLCYCFLVICCKH